MKMNMEMINELFIYKFYKKELKYIGKKYWKRKNLIDRKEINNKRDHILIAYPMNINLYWYFNNLIKKVSPIYNLNIYYILKL